jgi:hypothetical protein
MKRWLAATALALAFAPPALAQKYQGDVTLCLQSGLGVAVGTFSYDYTFSVQAMLQADYAVVDGTAVGIRASYQMFNTEDTSPLANMKLSQLCLQGKQFFNADAELGAYGVLGWGVYWYREDIPSTLSEPAWGGYGGLGLHYEASDRVAFFGEAVFNLVFSSPEEIKFFGLTAGVTIGLREE